MEGGVRIGALTADGMLEAGCKKDSIVIVNGGVGFRDFFVEIAGTLVGYSCIGLECVGVDLVLCAKYSLTIP